MSYPPWTRRSLAPVEAADVTCELVFGQKRHMPIQIRLTKMGKLKATNILLQPAYWIVSQNAVG